MRLRKIKNASLMLEDDVKYMINNPKDFKGKWQELFNNLNEIHIEIGCGKGQFITQMASNFPNINFIAIEKYDSVLLRALQNANKFDLNNLKLILLDATDILEVFAEKEVSRIYLNFSDPWKKNRQHKRRLTSPAFLAKYKEILLDNGTIFQKTDNRDLFEYSLESFSQNEYYLSNICLDLHNTELDFLNITTEYEDKWSSKGPIFRLEARKYKNSCLKK